jgi:DNA invertase Pin-like site-specific DNA recombinase
MAANLLVPAAQYLRMSTEHQQYSLENQSTAIQKYAEAHSFEVVRTYSDAAKSGLVLRHRLGLRQLLQDVVSGAPGYRVILVYDFLPDPARRVCDFQVEYMSERWLRSRARR